MITLVLAFHNHQPVGNFDWVIEDAYRRAYLPLMRMLAKHPRVRFAQHYTGILLDWFERHHPEFLATVGACVASGQTELLSGGYFEPILSMLPERDRRAQIRLLNDRITGTFGVQPAGMWLAERVWEPSLPSTLHAAAMRYTILDDTHFKAAGLTDADLTGYFITEDQGKPLAVFPIDKRLRYTMPFESPEVTIEYLRSLDVDGADRVVVFADDGEKFGVWPDTYRTVYEHGWLKRFIELLEHNASWLRTAHPLEVLRTARPAGRLYLPTASYAEMLHWALPTPEGFIEFEKFEHMMAERKLTDRWGSFVRGGFWRNFMVKYPEINAMQKKMLRVSERIERVRRTHGDTVPSSGGEIDRAYRHLLAAQCNCPYWHGVFGGIYLANIRAAMYSEMIAAERLLDGVERIAAGRIEATDYDLDGETEIIYENTEAALYLAPAAGGTIFEFDYKPAGYNFIDLLRRRREGYHERLASFGAPVTVEAEATPSGGTETPANTADTDGGRARDDAAETAGADEARSIHDIVRVKESGLEKALQYDAYRHAVLADHFFAAAPTAEGLRDGTLDEVGDFLGARYEAAWHRDDDGLTTVLMRREGTLTGAGTPGRPQRVLVEKAVSIADGSADIRVDYAISSVDGTPLETRFGLELAYAMSAGTEPDRYYRFGGARPEGLDARLDSVGSASGTNFALVDEWLGVQICLEFAEPAAFLRAPIQTVSLSEEGFERNYQGSIVLATWNLAGVRRWNISFTQCIESIRETT